MRVMHASPADAALARVEALVERDTEPVRLARIRARVAARLLVGPPAPDPDPGSPAEQAEAAFVDQFVIDVAGIDDAQRADLWRELGPDTLGAVQAVYVVDLGIRRQVARDRLGLDAPGRDDAVAGGPAPSGSVAVADGDELWPAIEAYLRAVARLDALDPVTSELVRLRGAAAHRCRLCQSRRSVAALDEVGSGDLFTAALTTGPSAGGRPGAVARVPGGPDGPVDVELSARQAAAVALVDVLVWQPNELDGALVATLHEQFTPVELDELVHDIVRNAANKIAVAFAADAPAVTDGIEYYDLDADGEVVADVDLAVVRAATAR